MNFSHLIYDTCKDVKLLITQLTIDYYSTLKFKYKNLNMLHSKLTPKMLKAITNFAHFLH